MSGINLMISIAEPHTPLYPLHPLHPSSLICTLCTLCIHAHFCTLCTFYTPLHSRGLCSLLHLLCTRWTPCTLCTYSPLCVLSIPLHSFKYWKMTDCSPHNLCTLCTWRTSTHPASVHLSVPSTASLPISLSAPFWTICNPLHPNVQICILKEDWLLLLTPFQILNCYIVN